MKSEIPKRSIIVNGRKTSISLEEQFWSELKAIAAERQLTLSKIISMVDHDRGELFNLSSALRCLVLARYYPPAASATLQQQTPIASESQPATRSQPR
jgi:predicted DNA-binding ribbon-helix-helix protein